MTKLTSHVSFAAAILAGIVLSACGASTTADPTDTTPQAETRAEPEGQTAQNLEGDGPRGDRGRHRGWMNRKHDPEKMFARMDKDGDGKILIADLPERVREHLAKADTDKDGALTRDELKAAHEAHKAEWLKKVDTNGDGTVSDEEKAAAHAKFEAEMKKRLDTNGDGTVSDEEKAAARAKFGHGPGGHHHHEGPEGHDDGAGHGEH